jgi:NAD(P)-dependent dehydrogenase (short-subunit alcohol dehydrogenase family)
MELEDRVAVITGSTGRLGSEIALALAQGGAHCVCHYYENKGVAEELAAKIEDLGGGAIAVCADLARVEQREDLFVKGAELGEVGILVNSAAVFSREPLAGVTAEDIHRTFDINLVGPILASRYFAQAVQEKTENSDKPVAKIINLADVGGIRPWAGYSVYCASKAGLIAVTKSLAKELAPTITVNAIAPGIINWLDEFDEDDKKRRLSHIPARRIGLAKEVTSAIIFLLENDYITGQVLNVDGGQCI